MANDPKKTKDYKKAGDFEGFPSGNKFIIVGHEKNKPSNHGAWVLDSSTVYKSYRITSDSALIAFVEEVRKLAHEQGNDLALWLDGAPLPMPPEGEFLKYSSALVEYTKAVTDANRDVYAAIKQRG